MKTMSGVFASILAVVVLGTVSFAQPPDTSWTRTYGGPLADDASSLVQTADGGYVLAGYTYSFGAGNQDFWLVKANGNGDSVWSRTFGGPGFEGANTLAQTADGGFILAGFSNSFGMGGYNLWLVKTNANGNSSWSRSYGGPGWDGANCVLQTSDGGYLLGGLTNSYGAGDFDFWLLKTNGNGDSVWSRTFGGAQYEDIFSMQPTREGGYILAGRTSSYGAGNYDAYLVKANANGDSAWTRRYGGTGFECATAILQIPDGYIFAGITASYGAGNEDVWLLKTNANGDSVWSRTFGGISWDRAYSIQRTADGGYIIAGRTDSYGAGQGDFYLIKTDSNGGSLWSRTFGGAAFDGAYLVRQTTDSGFVLAGFTESFGAGGRNFYLVKTRRDPLATGDHFILHPSSFILSVFPNPFNPSAEIRYDLPHAGHVSLRVFDLLGRKVAVLKDGFVEAGTHRVTFDGGGLPSGIYFARLDAGTVSQTRKLMLLK